MKRPLGIVGLFYGAGLLLAEWFQPPLVFLFVTALTLALGAIFIRQARPWLIWPLILFTAWTNLVCRTAIVSPHDLRNVLSTEPEQVVIRGALCETPVEHAYLRNGEPASRTVARLDVTGLRRDFAWRPAVGRIIITTPAKLPPALFAG